MKALLGLSSVSQHGLFVVASLDVHGVQIALLQHSNLYESMASSLHSAQKKALGKTLVGRELYKSARHSPMLSFQTYRASSFKSAASGAAFGSVAMVKSFIRAPQVG